MFNNRVRHLVKQWPYQSKKAKNQGLLALSDPTAQVKTRGVRKKLLDPKPARVVVMNREARPRIEDEDGRSYGE
jgi:hypothetical protein